MAGQSITEQTKGKTLSFSDSWNRHQIITVEGAYESKYNTVFIGIDSSGKEDRIYVPNEIVEELLRTGNVTQEMKYCTNIMSFKMSPEAGSKKGMEE